MSVVNESDGAALRVLVVDPLDETRTVLETVLARRGVQIVSASRRDEGLRLAREFHPDVVVLDCELTSPAVGEVDTRKGGASAGENLDAAGKAFGQPFELASPENPPSLILLGSARRLADSGTARYVQKPYLYGALVHTIEELLAQRRAA